MHLAIPSALVLAFATFTAGCGPGVCSVLNDAELEDAVENADCFAIHIGRTVDFVGTREWRGSTELLSVTVARPVEIDASAVVFDAVNVDGVNAVSAGVGGTAVARDVVQAVFTGALREADVTFSAVSRGGLIHGVAVGQTAESSALERLTVTTVDDAVPVSDHGLSFRLQGVPWDTLELNISDAARPTFELHVDAAPLVQLQKFGSAMQRVYAFGVAADFVDYVAWLDGQGYAGAVLVCAADVERLDDCVPFAG